MKGKRAEPAHVLLKWSLLTGLLIGGLPLALRALNLYAQVTHSTVIQSISVCSPMGRGGQGSCPSGTFDTQQIVLAPDGSGNAINRYEAPFAPDEHSSVFAPGTLNGNNDYLFFLASGTRLNGGIGTVVLSGGSGPDGNGQWTFANPKEGYGAYPAGFGQVFRQPFPEAKCPVVADGNPAHQDATFDLDYAAPGSVVVDPTGPAGSLLMVYEGANDCPGNLGGDKTGTGAYVSFGVATSLDYGKNWPTYRGTPAFSFVPMPGANMKQGPNAPLGATGKNVCMGNDCATTPPAAYGRYTVIAPPKSITTVMATGQPLQGSYGMQNLSAFLDDAGPVSAPYLYVVYNSNSDLAIARGQLGGSAPLTFEKWNGKAFAAPGIGGVEAQLLPSGARQNCGGSLQTRTNGSINYLDATQQYVLFFTCVSNGDPAGASNTGNIGAAWFYSTSYDVTDPTQWSTPLEIPGTWAEFNKSGVCQSYPGWYHTWMSLGTKPGHIAANGYVFYLWGCEDNPPTALPRQLSSRAFTISIGPPVPSLLPGSLANGATYLEGGLVPGSWAQVKGAGLSSVSRIWDAADFNGLGNQLPTKLSGTEVKVNGLSAAVYFIDPGQVNFQVPSGVSGTASVQVIKDGVASNTITAASASSAPGVFPVNVNGTNYPAGVFPEGKLVGDPAVNPVFRKARAGDVIQLFATGLAATPGGILPNLQIVSNVKVTIADVTVPADFAGLVAVGEFQINFTVPQQFASRAEANYPISISVNGVSSPVIINSNPPGQLVIPIQH
jgi:uncharacterized protein (TIGR03437 family)